MSSNQNFIMLEHNRIKSRICTLYLAVRNAQRFERDEAHGLRCALDTTYGLTRFEYELLYFFDHNRQCSGDVLDEAILSLETVSQLVERSDFWCVEDFRLPNDVPQKSLNVFREYFRHMDDVMETIDEEISSLKLFKLCRAFGLMSRLSDHEHCFPDYISVMMHVIRDTGMSMHLHEPHSRPDRVGLTRERRFTKAEESLFPFVLGTYKTWDSTYLISAREKFEGVLPQRFIDLMLGFHELARVSHKMTLNEYCRTCVVFCHIHGFLRVGSLVLSKENVEKPLYDIAFILIESLALLGLPRVKTPGKERVVKIFSDRLDAWFKEILTLEWDREARDRRVASVKKYASQYDFINDHVEDRLFLSYRECYCSAMGLLQRYSDKDIPLNYPTSENNRANVTLLRLLNRFKKCVIMSPKDFLQHSVHLYSNLPDESLCLPKEIPNESKPHNHSSKLEKSGSENFKVTHSLDECTISRESDPNCQPPEDENERSHSENSSSSADIIGTCKVSSENENRQTLNVLNYDTPKSCDAPDICVSSQPTNLSFVPVSSEGSKGEYLKTEVASGDIIHRLLCKNEIAQATHSFAVEPSRIFQGKGSCKTSASTTTSRPILCKDSGENVKPVLCKDSGENVGCRSTDSFTVVQIKLLEFSRVSKTPEPPSTNTSQSCGNSSVNHSNQFLKFVSEEPFENDIQTLNRTPDVIRSSEASNRKNISQKTHLSNTEIKNSGEYISRDDSLQSAVLPTVLIKQSTEDKNEITSTLRLEVTTAVESSVDGWTGTAADEKNTSSRLETDVAVASLVSISTELNKDETEISSTLEVITAVQSSEESAESFKDGITIPSRLEVSIEIENSVNRSTKLTDDETEISSTLAVTTAEGSSGESTKPSRDEINFLSRVEVAIPTELTEDKTKIPSRVEVAIPTELTEDKTKIASRVEVATPTELTEDKTKIPSRVEVDIPTELTEDKTEIASRVEVAIPTELTEDKTEIVSTVEVIQTEFIEDKTEIPSRLEVTTSAESLGESTEFIEDEINIQDRLEVDIAVESSVSRSTELTENKTEISSICEVAIAIESPEGEAIVSSEDESDISSTVVKAVAVESLLSGSIESTEDKTEISKLEVTTAVQSSEESAESFKDGITIPSRLEVSIKIENPVSRSTKLTDDETEISSTLAATTAEESSGESTKPSRDEINFLSRVEVAIPTKFTEDKTKIPSREEVAIPTELTEEKTENASRVEVAIPTELTEDKTEIPSRLEVTTSAESLGESTEFIEDEINIQDRLEVDIAVESSVSRSTELTENKTEISSICEVAIAIESPEGEAIVSSEDENDISSTVVKAVAVESLLSGSTEYTEDKTEIPNTLEFDSAVEISAGASTESSSGENVRVKLKSEFVSECGQSSSDAESFVVISEDDVPDLVDTILMEKCVEMQAHVHSARTPEYPAMCSVM